MQQIELNFQKILTKSDLMIWFKNNFKFPDYFGQNWDAVIDCLGDFCKMDVTINILNRESLPENLKPEYKNFLEVIEGFNNHYEPQIILLQRD